MKSLKHLLVIHPNSRKIGEIVIHRVDVSWKWWNVKFCSHSIHDAMWKMFQYIHFLVLCNRTLFLTSNYCGKNRLCHFHRASDISSMYLQQYCNNAIRQNPLPFWYILWQKRHFLSSSAKNLSVYPFFGSLCQSMIHFILTETWFSGEIYKKLIGLSLKKSIS